MGSQKIGLDINQIMNESIDELEGHMIKDQQMTERLTSVYQTGDDGRSLDGIDNSKLGS